MPKSLDLPRQQRILPVIGLTETSYADEAAGVLWEGGMRSVEFTARFDGWEKAVENVRKHFPDLFVGVGTVLNAPMAERAIACGADFIVSPGFSADVLETAEAHGTVYLPGCATATELTAVYNLGIRTVKFFPAEALGGVSAIRLLAGAFRGMRFLPTGGLDFDRIGEYLACKDVIAVGGSFMCPSAMLLRHERDEIVRLCRKALTVSYG